MSETPITVNWLVSLPCVVNREVIIDTRGVWPTARINNTLNAKQIHTRDEFMFFIAEYLDVRTPMETWATENHYHVSCTGNSRTCKVYECTDCGTRDCPYEEPLHYHHDGCPACDSNSE